MKLKTNYQLQIILVLLSCYGCRNSNESIQVSERMDFLSYSKNVLDYRVTPKDSIDKTGLMFSDQGAWFGYSLPKTDENLIGFSGPFLMTQQNGVWSSDCLSNINIYSGNNKSLINLKNDLVVQNSYSSHLEQLFENENIELKQVLVYLSGHTAIQKTTIKNKGNHFIQAKVNIKGHVSNAAISISKEDNVVKLISKKSSAVGYIQIKDSVEGVELLDDKTYKIVLKDFRLESKQTKEIVIAQTFIFPEYSWEKENNSIHKQDFDVVLGNRKQEKEYQLKKLITNRKSQFKENKYAQVLTKSQLTLQNNWRIPAGEIKHEGLFPSYHYEWFNGFWSWDSWKHAVGLSYYDLELAKNQIRAMFDFQKKDGFIVDCVFRDTTIEAHNYRDTKPPLSVWAVVKIYEKEKDLKFIKELYPKLKKYHKWWYVKRDHDKDGLCEYGSTDGSLIAAKWESGMDNAIRFDNSKILKNEEGAFSLNQESVDLNAYLYAEKTFLAVLAKELNNLEDFKTFSEEAKILKTKIQYQFYDEKDGWFYDTTIDGSAFIKGEGSEGWIPLWANAASQDQAIAVKNIMMNPEKFYTKIPFQTMSADHERFDPLAGYWRGPNWLDQAYFGVKGLRNYGFNTEADKATIQIIKGADGILEKGKSIRENYHPLTGEGLNAKNFSWSAAHLIQLLQNN